MSLNDAIARWCPTLDPAYGTSTLTDLIGGVGNFILPSSGNWGTSGSLRFLNWSSDWSTTRTPGPIQSSASSFTVSLWHNRTSGVAWTALRSTPTTWWGWYLNRSIRDNDFSGSFGSNGVGAPAGIWAHVVLRQIGGSHVLYSVNGVHASPSAALSALTGFADFRLCLGASHRSFATDNFFRGQQDDWIYYNRALTDAEVESLYVLGRGGDLSAVPSTAHRRRSAQASIRSTF